MSSAKGAGQAKPRLVVHTTPVELGELLVSAWRTFARYGTARFGEHGLSPARVRLITALAGADGIRMSDMADRLGVTSRAITGLVDALEAEGILTRQPDPTDRRAFRLGLTSAGAAKMGQIDELQRQVSEEAFHALKAEDRDRLGELLRAVIATTRASGAAPCPDR
jgi:DNA-binding MarR family transcriptional regulator